MIKHAIPDNTDNTLNAAISVTEVKFALKQLKNKKTSGSDQLSNEILKSFGHLYSELFSSFLTKVFFENKFPKLWTTSLITLIFQKRSEVFSKQLHRNYSITHICRIKGCGGAGCPPPPTNNFRKT